MWPKAEGAIDSEVMRARGMIVLVKSNKLVKKISRLNIFCKLKLDINPFLPPKHYKCGGLHMPLGTPFFHSQSSYQCLSVKTPEKFCACN